MKINLSGVSTGTIVRMLMTLIAAVNVILGYCGVHLIPLTETDAGILVNAGIICATVIVWFWGCWKNNSFTVNAQMADQVLRDLNAEEQ